MKSRTQLATWTWLYVIHSWSRLKKFITPSTINFRYFQLHSNVTNNQMFASIELPEARIKVRKVRLFFFSTYTYLQIFYFSWLRKMIREFYRTIISELREWDGSQCPRWKRKVLKNQFQNEKCVSPIHIIPSQLSECQKRGQGLDDLLKTFLQDSNCPISVVFIYLIPR